MNKIEALKLKEIIKYFFKVPFDSLPKEEALVQYLWLRGYKIVPLEER